MLIEDIKLFVGYFIAVSQYSGVVISMELQRRRRGAPPTLFAPTAPISIAMWTMGRGVFFPGIVLANDVFVASLFRTEEHFLSTSKGMGSIGIEYANRISFSCSVSSVVDLLQNSHRVDSCVTHNGHRLATKSTDVFLIAIE